VKSLRKSSSEQGEKLQGLAVMGELDDKMANFLSTICSTAPGDFGNIQKFFSISKISYVRNSKLFFRHSSTRKYNGVAPVISTPPSGPSIDTTASQAPIAQRILKNHLLDLW
jgi:hypothetical protein